MSSDNTIGDFRVSLNVDTNKDSFATAKSSLDGVGDNVVKLLGVVRNAVPLIVDTLAQIADTAGQESALAQTSTYLGLNTQALEKWRIAAKIAGADANGLTGEMQKLQQTFNAMNEGQVNEDLATKLSYLGLNYMQIQGMDSDKRMQTILEAAKAMKDQSWASDIVASIYGSNAAGMLNYINTAKTSVGALLSKASGAIFTDDASKMKSLGFNTELQTMLATAEQLKALFGSQMADRLTPLLEGLNNWLAKNGTTLVDRLVSIVDSIGEFGSSFKKIWDAAKAYKSGDKEAAKNFIEEAQTIGTEAGAELVEGLTGQKKETTIAKLDTKKNLDARVADAWKKLYPGKDPYINTWFVMSHKIPFNSLPYDLQQDLNSYFKTYGQSKSNFPLIQDGIIAPGGKVTQVAPDDWVFAARDVGALASAFLPKHTQPSGASFVINQTFNVQNNNDLGETIRQQAQRGSYDGLSQALQQTQVRMSLMPSLA